jgi:hypothetical protein
LDEDSSQGTEDDLVRAHLEAVRVRALADLLLHAQVSLDILEFPSHTRIFDGQRQEARERVGCVVIPMPLYEVTGGLGQCEHAYGENTGPDKLEGDGYSVGAMVIARLGGLIDDRGEEETDGLK